MGDLRRELLLNGQIAAEDFHRVGALHARQRLLEVVLDVLREVVGRARHLVLEFLVELLDQLFLGVARRPLIERLERREHLDIGERRCIAAVVGPAVLGDRGDDLRMAEQDFAQLLGRRRPRHQPGRRRQLDADPQVAFFQVRQELAAEPGRQQPDHAEEYQADQSHGLATAERPVQHRLVDEAQRPHQQRLDLVDLIRQHQRGQRRRDGERREQGAGERIAIGLRHRAEDLALDPLHGEQRHERRNSDGSGEEDRVVDLHGADQDQSQPVRPHIEEAGSLPRRVLAPVLLGKFLECDLPLLGSRLEIAEYVFHHDDGGIDDDAEVDRADRQQVGVLAGQHHHDDGKEQRERDVHRHHHGAAQIAEEYPLDEEHQQAAKNEVVQHRMGGHLDEAGTVIVGDELHPGRQ
jgi:hypothetical protein